MVQVQTPQKNLNVVQTSWQWAFPLESSKSGMDGAVGKSTKRGLALINPFPRRAVYF